MPHALLTSEHAQPTDALTTWLLIGTVVLLASIAGVRLATRSGLPTLLIYLGIGLAIGSGGLGIKFDNPALAQILGYSALVLILAEGGLTTDLKDIRPSLGPALALSTVGVLVSVGVTGVAAFAILDVTWPVALLVGAILSSTDAAAVFSVLRKVPLPPRLKGILEAESGFNDAPVVLLVVGLAALATPGADNPSPALLLVSAFVELALGAVLGWAVGRLLGWLLARFAPSSSGLFSIAVLAVTVLAYALADALHLSGFIATYVCALVLGNLHLPHRPAVRGFAQAFGWLAQIGLFVMLGLLAAPDRLVHYVFPAVALGLVLLLLARPVSVVTTLGWWGFSWREHAFMSWAGLRGAVPVVLATVPVTAGAPGTRWIFDLVFVLVCIFTLVQAPTLPWITARLGLAEGSTTTDLDVETTRLDDLDAQMLQVDVNETSRLAGVEVFELRLPPGANLALVVRDGASFVPSTGTVLRRGDSLLVVTTSSVRRQAVHRIREVSRAGRLAGWRREDD